MGRFDAFQPAPERDFGLRMSVPKPTRVFRAMIRIGVDQLFPSLSPTQAD